MPKVLLVVGDAAEATDTLYPYYRVQEEGYQCCVAAPEKRTYHLVQHSAHHGWDITVETPSYSIAADIAFRDIDPQGYIGVVVSGGRAPEYIRYDADLVRCIKAMHADKKPIATVCHGIEVVAAADIIRQRRVTTVAKCKYDAENAGATYIDAPVVVDDNLVTARTWSDSAVWMREYIKLLVNYGTSL